MDLFNGFVEYRWLFWCVVTLSALLAVVCLLAFLINKFFIEPVNTMTDPIVENIKEKMQRKTVSAFGKMPCGRYIGFSFIYIALLGYLCHWFSVLCNLNKFYQTVFLLLSCIVSASAPFFVIFPGDKKMTYAHCIDIAEKIWFLFFIKNSETKYKIIWSVGVILGILLWLNVQIYTDSSIFPYKFVSFMQQSRLLFPYEIVHYFRYR